MKKIILIGLLLISNAVSAQETWQSMGPDDFNQPSYGSVLKTKIVSKNNLLFVVNLEFVTFGSKNKITVNMFNGLRWEEIGTPFFTQVANVYYDIAIDDNNTPYLCFVDTNNSNKASVKKYNGTNWETVGTQFISTSSSSSTSLAIDSNNIVYIIYRDGANNDKATVQKFNGINWEIVGNAGFSSGFAFSTDIVIDNNNIIYATYKNASNNGLLYVKKFNGTSWVDVGVSGFPSYDTSSVNTTYTQTPMVIDNNNVPYVIYCDTSNNFKATVQKFNGINWEVVGTAGFTSERADFPSIAIDNNNTPYVVYCNNTSSLSVVQKFNGVTWEMVGNQNISDANTKWTSIAFDNNNLPNVAFKQSSFEIGDQAKVKRFNGSDWEIVGDRAISSGLTSTPEISVDNNNVAYLVYKDLNKAKKITVKKFNGINWQSVGIEGFSSGEVYCTSIAIDSNNIPYVAYIDVVNDAKITVQKFNGVSWEIVGTAGFTVLAESLDLRINNLNVPYIVYRGGNSMADNPRCNVQKFNGINWEFVGLPNFSLDKIYNPQLAFDNNEVPYVSYTNQNYSQRLTVEKFNGVSWQTVGGAGFSSSGASCVASIKFNNINVPYIAYQDGFTGSRATVRTFDGTNWVVVGISGFSDLQIGKICLEIDNSNVPYVFYNEEIDNYKYVGTVKKFNGSSWQLVGSVNFLAGFVDNITMTINGNNIPYVSYSGNFNRGATYGKYFGTVGALSTNDNIFSQEKLAIYPNPVKYTFSISGNDVKEIEIFDLVGKQVWYKKNPDTEINIEILPKGFYVAKIKNEKGNSSVKLIKE
ncbi:T9SS type A sorting domain-containing protein [Flavobacterium sp. GT3R68]|uniref:T9SS type A sorting domain-containing protein n=1 Tax=Flavobacterium sp. GT3R68 TaxID=2594437 RepID=UPI000F8839EA|nr:T9SS type A sorting domain-containing protein [Flavobacterium sp. GT3R68]RTY95887.1 T9SS type A sorting domain-containing protein [Flavobacterium sp. GSN2]TRW93659.1 T9SS type A sorting domain-containing protein [Flavobacterium sp. GT3R68]